MSNESLGTLNYEAEYHRVCEHMEYLSRDNENLKEQIKSLERALDGKENEISFLKGQVKAFEFCIARRSKNSK